ncbi:hypothetical protein CANCADRAFT_121739 [Tortispora caseinolytica NRRL Y-17796]|uniref:DDHD domain-containing protein n=1 Tax=Tortispora caseinolytica NRRL Y-17796 TaxID=767744 RepID=A0A1E4THM4_9ASCO|nr:hypothetical protein CANCADRAFT_121739 [Tortispora caseinolytica NRRL Y-17796]
MRRTLGIPAPSVNDKRAVLADKASGKLQSSAPPQQPWFFHNSLYPLDDPAGPPELINPNNSYINPHTESITSALNSNLSALELKPIVEAAIQDCPKWKPFDPVDNAALERAYQKQIASKSLSDSTEHVSAQNLSVLVGIDKVYQVDLTTMVMSPVYWTPLVGDAAVVIRTTWVYSNSLQPVLEPLESALNKAYHDIEPWNEVYAIECETALKYGIDAESKLRHPLDKSKYVLFEPETQVMSSSNQINKAARKKAYIYTESTLNPSSLFSRSTPLAAMLAGKSNGTPVQRDFDYDMWLDMYGGPPTAILNEELRNRKVTQLVLVIHGIGQKRSEKNEQSSFTYATSRLRQLVNNQVLSNNVIPNTKGRNRLMVLPVNWRRRIKPEDDPFRSMPVATDKKQHLSSDSSIASTAKNTGTYPKSPSNAAVIDDTDEMNIVQRRELNVQDITIDSIPSVRSLVTDVVLDIPYYLSHHKESLLQCLTEELNRIYGEWCANNPGFESYGQVSLIGHSLGSIMTLDILCRQPDNPEHFRDNSDADISSFLRFPVRNFFCVGSPVALFFLLNCKTLIPRRSRLRKDERDLTVASDKVGEYGCPLVDNIYNIMHLCDPIAYKLNPCVDTMLASQITPAAVPGSMLTTAESYETYITEGKSEDPPTSSGFLANFITTKKSKRTESFHAQSSEGVAPLSSETALNPSALPKEVELDIRDFSRETVAEKRMMNLNENGQIDYTVYPSTLESHYISMLSAHFSYWSNRDVAQLIALESLRRPGPRYTVPCMRATRASKLP